MLSKIRKPTLQLCLTTVTNFSAHQTAKTDTLK